MARVEVGALTGDLAVKNITYTGNLEEPRGSEVNFNLAILTTRAREMTDLDFPKKLEAQEVTQTVQVSDRRTRVARTVSEVQTCSRR